MLNALYKRRFSAQILNLLLVLENLKLINKGLEYHV